MNLYETTSYGHQLANSIRKDAVKIVQNRQSKCHPREHLKVKLYYYCPLSSDTHEHKIYLPTTDKIRSKL